MAVPAPWLRAVHLDEPAAAAESVVGLAEARELLWYAPGELETVNAASS